MLLAFLSFACSNDDDNKSEPCTTNVVQGLEILVTNLQNLPITTGITVTATDGDYTEQLQITPIENVYTGAFEREGTSRIC